MVSTPCMENGEITGNLMDVWLPLDTIVSFQGYFVLKHTKLTVL